MITMTFLHVGKRYSGINSYYTADEFRGNMTVVKIEPETRTVIVRKGIGRHYRLWILPTGHLTKIILEPLDRLFYKSNGTIFDVVGNFPNFVLNDDDRTPVYMKPDRTMTLQPVENFEYQIQKFSQLHKFGLQIERVGQDEAATNLIKRRDNCVQCGAPMDASTRRRQFCGSTCRVAHHRLTNRNKAQ